MVNGIAAPDRRNDLHLSAGTHHLAPLLAYQVDREKSLYLVVFELPKGDEVNHQFFCAPTISLALLMVGIGSIRQLLTLYRQSGMRQLKSRNHMARLDGGPSPAW